MKRYIKSLIAASIIGFFLLKIFLNQYSEYNGIRVSSLSNNVYFIQYGVFSGEYSMNENTTNLQNFVYNVDSDEYYVYVGITSSLDNAKKIQDYYKSLGYETIIKEYGISNKEFIEKLKNLDKVLESTTDMTDTSSLINEILETYEEVVINGNKN